MFIYHKLFASTLEKGKGTTVHDDCLLGNAYWQTSCHKPNPFRKKNR